MDATKVQDEAKKLVEGFTSLDPVEYDAAINNYFEPDAAVDNFALHITGVTKIKKLTAFQAYIAETNELVGEPKYDERKYKTPPILPSLPIIGSHFTGEKNWYPCDATFHLVSDDAEGKPGGSGGQGRKLYVRKVGVVEPQETPKILIAMTLATISAFYAAHDKESWISIIFAAIWESYSALWQLLVDEKSRREAQANLWKDMKTDDLKRLLEQAKAAGADLQGTLESQAKARGIPVDEYKQQAGAVINELVQKVNVATHYFEEQGDSAKAQVKENVKAKSAKIEEITKENEDKIPDEAAKVKDEVKNKVTEAKDKTEETLTEANDNAKEAVENNVQNNDSGSDLTDLPEEEENETSPPHTPLGGHDPTAENAFSYADAAK